MVAPDCAIVPVRHEFCAVAERSRHHDLHGTAGELPGTDRWIGLCRRGTGAENQDGDRRQDKMRVFHGVVVSNRLIAAQSSSRNICRCSAGMYSSFLTCTRMT